MNLADYLKFDEYKKEFKKIIDENSSIIDELNIKIIILKADIDNIKSGMDKIEKKFTWGKIFVVGGAVLTAVFSAIGAIIAILNNLGILKLPK